MGRISYIETPGGESSNVETEIIKCKECDNPFGPMADNQVFCSSTCEALNESDQEILGDVCEDCTNTDELKPWKYEPEVKLCPSCYDERMEEDDHT